MAWDSLLIAIIVTTGVSVFALDMDTLEKEYNQVTSAWCAPEQLEENVIDSVYECFHQNSGSRDFTIQIQCENRIFPLNMTKNAVRKMICRNDPLTDSLLKTCYRRLGLSVMANDPVSRMTQMMYQHQVMKLVSLTVSPFPSISHSIFMPQNFISRDVSECHPRHSFPLSV